MEQAYKEIMRIFISEAMSHHERVVAELRSIEVIEPLQHALPSPQQSGAVHP